MLGGVEPQRRILVVDDVRDNRRFVAACLRDEHLVIDEAGDGRAALRLALANRPQLVIIDVDLPFLDGLRVVRDIRAQGLTAEHLRVIAWTAAIEEDAVAHCLEAGSDDFLGKPVLDPALLRAKVHAHLAAIAPGRALPSDRATHSAV